MTLSIKPGRIFSLPILLCLTLGAVQAQVKPDYVRTDFQMGVARKVTQSVNPIPEQQTGYFRHDHPPLPGEDVDAPTELPIVAAPIAKAQNTSGFLVNIGRNFEANQMRISYPADNALAISNDGLIVSAENGSVAYFKENGDSILRFGMSLRKFFNDSTLTGIVSDPRLVYDSYENRFILVAISLSNDRTDSRLLISFSKPLTADTVEWNHYQVACDSVFTGESEGMYWFDYPSIAISKGQLVVTAVVVNSDTLNQNEEVVSNAVIQFHKLAGYQNAILTKKIWKDVENGDGRKDIVISPASDALQSHAYDSTIYLVSNYSGNSAKFFWFELTGLPNSPSGSISGNSTLTQFFYSSPSYYSQLGGFGGDRIKSSGCRIQYALHQNGKVHFVFTRSDNGWSEIVLAQIKLANNAFSATTYSSSGSSLNNVYPSFASSSADSSQESFLIGYLRTGPGIFPEICAIHHDSSGWSLVPTTVRPGDGRFAIETDLIAPWDTLERWGDYSAMQRRYNDTLGRCWMAGSYPNGVFPNYFGITGGHNTFIAELGDSLPQLSLTEAYTEIEAVLFPNPYRIGEFLQLRLRRQFDGSIRIVDLHGRIIYSDNFKGNAIELGRFSIAPGTYFVILNSKSGAYESLKLIVLP